MILQKFISNNTSYSRRKATDLILSGRVKINGKIAIAGDTADTTDVIEIDSVKIQSNSKNLIYIKLYKPVGYDCTNRKFKDEKNIFDLLNKKTNVNWDNITREKLFIVGRLDKDSRGLVILTNDGDYDYKMMHPRFEVPKAYIVKINKYKDGLIKNQLYDLDAHDITKIKTKFTLGINIGDGDGVVSARKVQYLGGNRFEITLIMGKKRQIRRMFDVTGFEVADLIRVRIGNIDIKDLKQGDYCEFSP